MKITWQNSRCNLDINFLFLFQCHLRKIHVHCLRFLGLNTAVGSWVMTNRINSTHFMLCETYFTMGGICVDICCLLLSNIDGSTVFWTKTWFKRTLSRPELQEEPQSFMGWVGIGEAICHRSRTEKVIISQLRLSRLFEISEATKVKLKTFFAELLLCLLDGKDGTHCSGQRNNLIGHIIFSSSETVSSFMLFMRPASCFWQRFPNLIIILDSQRRLYKINVETFMPNPWGDSCNLSASAYSSASSSWDGVMEFPTLLSASLVFFSSYRPSNSIMYTSLSMYMSLNTNLCIYIHYIIDAIFWYVYSCRLGEKHLFNTFSTRDKVTILTKVGSCWCAPFPRSCCA